MGTKKSLSGSVASTDAVGDSGIVHNEGVGDTDRQLFGNLIETLAFAGCGMERVGDSCLLVFIRPNNSWHSEHMLTIRWYDKMNMAATDKRNINTGRPTVMNTNTRGRNSSASIILKGEASLCRSSMLLFVQQMKPVARVPLYRVSERYNRAKWESNDSGRLAC
jgi:hypothetical protein